MWYGTVLLLTPTKHIPCSQFWLLIRTFQANNGQTHEQDQLHSNHSSRHAALPCVPSSLSSYIKFNGAFTPSPALLQKRFSHSPFVFNTVLSSQSASQTKEWKKLRLPEPFGWFDFVVANHTFQWSDMNANRKLHTLTSHYCSCVCLLSETSPTSNETV